jgi:hypothetical protein
MTSSGPTAPHLFLTRRPQEPPWQPVLAVSKASSVRRARRARRGAGARDANADFSTMPRGCSSPCSRASWTRGLAVEYCNAGPRAAPGPEPRPSPGRSPARPPGGGPPPACSTIPYVPASHPGRAGARPSPTASPRPPTRATTLRSRLEALGRGGGGGRARPAGGDLQRGGRGRPAVRRRVEPPTTSRSRSCAGTVRGAEARRALRLRSRMLTRRRFRLGTSSSVGTGARARRGRRPAAGRRRRQARQVVAHAPARRTEAVVRDHCPHAIGVADDLDPAAPVCAPPRRDPGAGLPRPGVSCRASRK